MARTTRRLAGSETCARWAGRTDRRDWRFHDSLAPEEAGRDHGCGDLSGVNGTPLLRGVEFTHAPSQAPERIAGSSEKGKLE